MFTKGNPLQGRLPIISDHYDMRCGYLSLYPAIPVLAQLAPECSCHSGRDRGYAWAQKYELPLTKGCLGCHHCWVLINSQYGTNMSLQDGTIPWMDQPSTWWQVDFIVPLPSCRGKRFFFTGIEQFSG
uniref:Uncharacterized protein n=1 Tax=Myotis myotis TaxID=51298 RepID=A0A7J7ZXB0_MYOMY|nr:hypothetical protein mMyoMyo1_009635 [Myotis myotis]